MLKYKLIKRSCRLFSSDKIRRIIKFFDYYFAGLYRSMDKNHIFLYGAGIAFSLILSMIPFVLIIFSIMGNTFCSSLVESQLNKIIQTVIPYPKYSNYLGHFIQSRITEANEYRTISGFIGGFGLFFTSTWLFSSMRTSLNKIFGVSDEKNALIGILRDFGMVLLLIVFVFLLTIFFPIVNFIISTADTVELFKIFRFNDLIDFSLSAVTILIIFLLF